MDSNKAINVVIAATIGLILAGVFLPYLTYFDTFTSTNATVQTLMRTLFPIFAIIGGGLAVFKIRGRKS